MASDYKRIEIDREKGWTRITGPHRSWQADGLEFTDKPPPEILAACRDAAKHLNALAPARKRTPKPKPKA